MNQPLITVFNLNFYPAFLILLVCGIGAAVLLTLAVIRKRQRYEAEYEERIRSKSGRVGRKLESLPVNRVTSWEKETVHSILQDRYRRLASVKEADTEAAEKEKNLLDRLIWNIQDADDWEEVNLLGIDKRSVWYLNYLLVPYLVKNFYVGNTNETICLCVLLDHVNGGLQERGPNDEHYIDESIQAIPLNVADVGGNSTLENDATRIAGLILVAVSDLVKINENPSAKNKVQETHWTSDLEKIDRGFSESLVRILVQTGSPLALGEGFQGYIPPVVKALLYRLATDEEAMRTEAASDRLGGVTLSVLRSIAMVSDQQEYSDVLRSLEA